MAEDDQGDKTEDPTEHRREETRRKGNVARSMDLNAAGLMLAVAAVLLSMGPGLTIAIAEMMRNSLGGSAWVDIDGPFVAGHFMDLGGWALRQVLPIMVMLMLAALFLNVVQVGFQLTPEALMPKWGRLNPLEGLKRIVSPAGMVKLLVSLGKIVVLITIATLYVTAQLPALQALSELAPGQILAHIAHFTVELAFWLAIALVALALLDFTWQKWKFEQDLKMTKQQLRDEMKNMDGDPHIRHRRREAHRKLAQARDLNRVKQADVIVTNPTHISVALKYDPQTMEAPSVVAKGADEIALQIRKIAAAHGIPIVERRELARSLYASVKVGHPVPVEMYEVFVEIMAYVYKLTGRTPDVTDA